MACRVTMEQGTATMDSVLHAGITARGFGDQVKKLVNHSLLQLCFILNNQDSSSCIFCCDCFQMLKSLQMLVSICMETAERHTLTRDAQAGMQSKALQWHIFTTYSLRGTVCSLNHPLWFSVTEVSPVVHFFVPADGSSLWHPGSPFTK